MSLYFISPKYGYRSSCIHKSQINYEKLFTENSFVKGKKLISCKIARSSPCGLKISLLFFRQFSAVWNYTKKLCSWFFSIWCKTVVSWNKCSRKIRNLQYYTHMLGIIQLLVYQLDWMLMGIFTHSDNRMQIFIQIR